jgi:hypothetical protein
VSDTLSFYYGYNGDLDFFIYCYWRVLMQCSIHYDKNGKLEESIFFQFLSRTLFVALLEDESKIEELRLFPPDPFLNESWINYFEDTLSFVRILKTIFGRYEFDITLKELSFDLASKDYTEIEEKEYTKEEEKNRVIHYADQENVYTDWQSCRCDMKVITDLVSRKRKFDVYYEQVIEAFGKNEIITTDNYPPKLFLSLVLNSFLKYLKNIDEEGINSKEVSHFLHRNSEGKIVIPPEEKHCFSNILVDSFGGMFCVDRKAARQYFAARSVFYRTIFDYCMKNKKKLIPKGMI